MTRLEVQWSEKIKKESDRLDDLYPTEAFVPSHLLTNEQQDEVAAVE